MHYTDSLSVAFGPPPPPPEWGREECVAQCTCRICAADGTLWTWGGNGSWQLGDGSFQDKYSPTQITVPGCTAFVSIFLGQFHSAALCSGVYVP